MGMIDGDSRQHNALPRPLEPCARSGSGQRSNCRTLSSAVMKLSISSRVL
jgi:hypothetical protein